MRMVVVDTRKRHKINKIYYIATVSEKLTKTKTKIVLQKMKLSQNSLTQTQTDTQT